MAKLSEENIEIKVNVDTTDAVNSLKKLQRVARETVKELREVETVKVSGLRAGPIEEFPLIPAVSSFSTKELTDELARREGIGELIIKPDEYVKIIVQGIESGYERVVSGPSRILINQD